MPFNKVTPNDFIALRELGKGSFGEVYLVEKKDTGQLYAMKILYKRQVMNKNLVRYVMAERNILSITRHPFIIGLYFAFQTKDKLYLIIDYCPGGDLGEHLKIEKKFAE